MFFHIKYANVIYHVWKFIFCFPVAEEDTKGVIRIGKSKKDRQHNGQKKKDKMTNEDLQNTTQKTKNRATRTPKKPGVNSGAPEG
jgi:hypothetical protein